MRASLLLFAWIAGSAAAQQAPLLTLQEQDREGGIYARIKAADAVDINSSLRIQIDKAALRARLAREQPELAVKEIETVQRIQALVRSGLEALPKLRLSIGNWSDPAKRGDAARALDAVARATAPILREPALAAEIDRRLEDHIKKIGFPSVAEQYAIALDVALAYVNRLTGEIDQRLADRGFRVQLGAWIQTEGKSLPLHLEGFDTLPLGEFFEVKRWDLKALLSPETSAQFKAAQKWAVDINSGERSAGSLFRDALPDAIVEGIESQLTCVSDLEDPMRGLRDSVTPALVQVRKSVDETRAALLAFRQYLQSVQVRYAAVRPDAITDLAGLYSAVRKDVGDIEREAKALSDRAATLLKQLQAIRGTLIRDEQAAVDKVEGKAKECAEGIKAQLTAFRQMIHLLANGREVVTATLKFSDKVLSHDIGSLPETTELDLRRSGAREPGDVIIVRFGSTAAGRDGPHVEERHVRMYKILTHVDVAISLIFADPKKQTELKSRFQAAPAYSVLLKKGKRDSTFWNELLQPGIGLNIAALDFNSDQSLELGVGLVVSAFQDYIQLGYGYNLNASSAYWFLGFRFPLPGNAGISAKP
jgi:hypothetical protein